MVMTKLVIIWGFLGWTIYAAKRDDMDYRGGGGGNGLETENHHLPRESEKGSFKYKIQSDLGRVFVMPNTARFTPHPPPYRTKCVNPKSSNIQST